MTANRPLHAVTGIVAPLVRDNIDTDVIIPSREITSPSREGYGPKLFAPWRFQAPGGPENPEFILNRDPWRQAEILLTGSNFGCGSSREMAVWALVQFGIRCVIAHSFGTIFRNNCVRNGLLAICLPAEQIRALAERAAQAPLKLCVDLVTQRITETQPGEHSFTIEPLTFEFDADDKDMLLTGQDAIDRAWEHQAAIEAFEQRDRLERPWAWPTPVHRPARG